MRNMSFSMTVDRIKDGSKTVTRRLGWKNLKPGELVQAVEKAQGLKKGEKIKNIRVIEITGVSRELLFEIAEYPFDDRGGEEVRKEGFDCTPKEFIERFCKYNKCTEKQIVTRIEFKYITPG